MGAVVVVEVVAADGAVDDMRGLAIEVLAREPRIDVLALVGTRRGFDAAVVQPYLLTRLLADRLAAESWSGPVVGRRHAPQAPAAHRALLVHEWAAARRADRDRQLRPRRRHVGATVRQRRTPPWRPLRRRRPRRRRARDHRRRGGVTLVGALRDADPSRALTSAGLLFGDVFGDDGVAESPPPNLSGRVGARELCRPAPPRAVASGPTSTAATCARSSSTVGSVAPGFTTIAAHTTSPQLASGSPTTPTSSTAGCERTAVSTSTGATHSPPDRIDSERRPVMVR